ncbi:MAG TPA: sigma-70 family RNA polymerase sigma factor [Candidatus Polarisedimenticolia bacterium]|nr:sigma-70 family RNA polymerase sigma factor [Candidatus Polarisedimenticolia bacterium]
MKREEPSEDITGILSAWGQGEPGAVDRLFPLVYQELRALARRRAGHVRGETMRTTALVHEAYLRLVDQTRATYENRGHFFAVAAKVMRRLVVDHARERAARKRGGDAERIPIDDSVLADPGERVDHLALDQALGRLEGLDPRLGRLVELRYFAGLTLEETAEAMSISPATVKRDWFKARAFLMQEMAGTPSP